jgi:uncharacterized damage-inducible protein DinB
MPKKTSEIARIAAELERAYSGDAWHGPPMTEALKGVRAFCAPVKPIPEAHSIWEIVHHLTAWNEIVRRRFLGEFVNVTRDQDWPPIDDFSAEAWERDIAALHKAVQSLIGELKRASRKSDCDAVLHKKVRGKTHTVYVLLHGAVQHNLYHTGQISILRKAMD